MRDGEGGGRAARRVAQRGVEREVGDGGVQAQREHLLPLEPRAPCLLHLHEVVEHLALPPFVADAVGEALVARAGARLQHVKQALDVVRGAVRADLVRDRVDAAGHRCAQLHRRQPEQVGQALGRGLVDHVVAGGGAEPVALCADCVAHQAPDPSDAVVQHEAEVVL